MKKLFALLLALMLPLSVMAEGSQLTFEVETDSQVFAAWVQSLLKSRAQLDEDTAGRYAKALSAVLKDLRIRVDNQEHAAMVEVELAGSALLDVTIYSDENAAYVSSSLLPGYMVAFEQQSTSSALASDDDWVELGKEIVAAINTWFDGITATKSYGVFCGDAYDGGTQCSTWVFDDQDIAALVSAIMTDSLRDAVSAALQQNRLDAGELLKEFDVLNDRVSRENAHCYIVRLIENDKNEYVGLSFTVNKNATQLATISLGADADKLTLVVGLGLNSENYWWEYSVLKKQKNHLTLLKGESSEWTASKESAFSYVKESVVPAAAQVWNCNVTKSGARILWDGSVFSGTEANQEDKCCSFSGVMNPTASTFSAEWCLVSSIYTPIRIRVTGEPGKPIEPMDATAKVCSLTAEEDKELVTQLFAKISIETVARLMKLLPLDVIMTLGEMFEQ